MTMECISHKNFQAYDYQTSNEILKNNFIFNTKTQYSGDKVLVVCIGVNGSGKSTYLTNLYHDCHFKLPYLNADVLAQGLLAEEKMLASKKTTDIAYSLLNKGQSFCFESVFTHPSKIDLVKIAKKNGYKVVGIYVYTDDCDINKKRVEDRVQQGGHYVPPEKIEERFNKMKSVVCGLIEFCDELYFFDNSQNLNLKHYDKINEKEGCEVCQK